MELGKHYFIQHQKELGNTMLILYELNALCRSA